MWRRAVLALPFILAACGDLPQPFRGQPGAMASRLALPPPTRLAVPPPMAALLPNASAELLAGAMAEALVAQDVPAERTSRSRKGDWQLVLTAELRQQQVVPSYSVVDPAGISQGSTEGHPIPIRDWAEGDPATLRQTAADAAPGIVALLSRIDAARRQSDPNSLLNRPARIFVSGVKGAPGDGNRSLDNQMRGRLVDLGLLSQDTAQGADFTVAGEVNTAPGANGTLRIEVQWIVNDARNNEVGRILQINEVPPAAVATYWGDIANAVAKEASGGVRDVVLNSTGARRPQAGQAAAAPPATGGQAAPAGAR